jgi:transposase
MIFTGDIHNPRVFLRPGPTDMRKQINGLAHMAQGAMGGVPFDRNLFAFCNRRRDLIKIVYYDRNGFCLWMKRLEKRDKFVWPRTEAECQEISAEQLAWLLRGLDFSKAHAEQRCSRVI